MKSWAMRLYKKLDEGEALRLDKEPGEGEWVQKDMIITRGA